MVKLISLCKKITDGSHYSPVGTDEGIPMLSVKDMVENGFDYANCKFISIADYEALVKSDCKPLFNDVLIAKDGSYLKHVFVIKKEIDQAVLSSIGILRPNLKKINPEYLKYYLQTRSVKETVSKKYVSGSALPRIILKNFGEIDVIYKDLAAQSRIAKVLSDLDAKIALNNKINAELEAMAKLIYDYWFVQFEFPCLPMDYSTRQNLHSGRPSKQVNPNCDLSEKIRSFCTYKQTGGLPLPDGKTWFVYVLLCDDGLFYKGMTNDLYRRYYEHGTGQGAKHTKMHKPIKVIHWEAFETQENAALREKELKTGFGRTWLQREYEKLQKQQEKPGLPAHQNARPSKLMPAGKMVWSEELKREVPEGWEVKELKDSIETTVDYRGKTPRKLGADWSENLNDIVALSAKHVKGGKLVNLHAANRVSEDLYEIWMKEKLKVGDILMTSEAPCGEFFYLVGKTKYCLSQRLFAIRSNPDIIHHSYLFFELSSGNGYSQIQGKMSGSTVFGIRQDELRTVKVLIPEMKMQLSFSKQIDKMYLQIRNNEYQNQKLAELRDWLLPMLMNGQVGVKTYNEQGEQMSMAAEPKVKYIK